MTRNDIISATTYHPYTHFIGLDLSLTGTGVIALDSSANLILNHTLKPSKQLSKLKGPEFRVARLTEIRDTLNKIIFNLTLTVHSNNFLFAIEGYAYGAVNSAHQAGEIGGVVRTMLYNHMYPYIEIAPPMVKKYATGVGNAKKEQVIAWVLKRWGLLFSTSDEADAYVLARIIRDKWGGGASVDAGGNEVNLIEAQREVLGKLTEGDIVVKKAC